jgi:flagellin
MRALGQLNKTNSELGVRQMRLASGSRLNRAEDDSAGYTIANKLQAKTRGQAQALSNIGDAKGMLTVGEGALNTTMDILQTMKEKAVQAANDTMGSDERTAIQGQLTALTAEIDDIFGDAEFNGTQLFEGTDTLSDGKTGQALTFQVGASSSDTFGVEIASMSTSMLGGSATETTDANNLLNSVTFNGTDTVAAGTFAFTTNADDATLLDLTYDGGSGAVPIATAAAADFQGGTYETADGFKITLEDTAPANGQGFVVAGDAEAAFSLDVTTLSGAQAAIDQIDGAIDKVNIATSSIGDSQARLTIKQDNLDTSMTNYEAARSRIEDTDFAKEQMEIVKLQILQQTGIGSLAQANTGPQSVLSLING